jgi:hypothetical protein
LRVRRGMPVISLAPAICGESPGIPTVEGLTSMNETEFESRRPRDECGIFAVYGHEEAAKLTYFGLYALQHRGQESAGIVASDGKQVGNTRPWGWFPRFSTNRF